MKPGTYADGLAEAWPRWNCLAAGCAVLLLPLVFASATQQVWEDYYITFRSSINLAEGRGLVYQPGERVHTFTSPLGVLLPAVAYVVSGDESSALWLFRLASAAALGAAAVLLGRHALEHRWTRSAYWFAILLGLAETKTVAFSANGMETAILVFFAALTWREIARPGGPRSVWLALGFGGLMWTRPDACILAAAMAAAWWVCGPRTLQLDERLWWRRVLTGAAGGALVYAPWFIWAWSYYGSPVPQTVLAKGALAPEMSLWGLLATPLHLLVGHSGFHGLFAPIYYSVSGWPPAWNALCRVVACLAAFAWLFPFFARPTRAASVAVLFGAFYLHHIMPYPWYYAPWGLLAAVAFGGMMTTLQRQGSPWLRSILRTATTSLAAGLLAMGVAQAYTCGVQQRIVEDGVRREIGLWLRDNADPKDTVFAEPIGYIGYFSGLKILDFPGLCAPEVSALIEDKRREYAPLIDALQPTWLVLRPVEIAQQGLNVSGTLQAYSAVGFWNQWPAIQSIDLLPGRNWLGFDSQFVVYRRKDATTSAAR